ncbi:MAG: phosphoribosylformylglycinamidine synthase subunit PurQ, partial [Phenylobacterium sp.]|nr:phosphoribosylformylglycinamidine synthase subunit PurQ [Phenylobacterium sp.]
RNSALKYVCKPVELEIVRGDTRFTRAFGARRSAVMTVGNGEGAFFADAETLARIEGEDQVLFRYADNPNGSLNDIAGLINAGGNVLGLMPHPDRAFEEELGSADGALLFQSLLEPA